ncbi:MAG TPA: cyclic nucleotide-binding domain-containing protein [Sandaracinaceae bacterium LLY-WYZ-13_1]|nr:cyclic nucleotide-binding domain-containing protein [Sandaracinaceae bacterium LLY-WYZ-13_1]
MAGHPSADEVGQLSLFSGLSRDEHERLAALAEVETFEAGTTVFDEGDPPGDLYVMLDGRVTLCMRVPGQPETCFLSLRSGELLGWSALLRRRRVATARVVQRAQLLRIGASGLLELCEEDHHVGYALMRQAFEEMADRLQGTRLQLLDMFGKPGS